MAVHQFLLMVSVKCDAAVGCGAVFLDFIRYDSLLRALIFTGKLFTTLLALCTLHPQVGSYIIYVRA